MDSKHLVHFVCTKYVCTFGLRHCIHTMSSGAPLLLVAQSKDGSSALAILGDEELINGRSVFLTTMTIRVKITGHRYNI